MPMIKVPLAIDEWALCEFTLNAIVEILRTHIRHMKMVARTLLRS